MQKARAFANDKGLTTSLSVLVSEAPVIASTSALEVQMHVMVVVLAIVQTTILVTALEVDQLVTRAAGFSTRELSLSPSPTKRSRGDSSSTPLEWGTSKKDLLLKGGNHKALTPFFWLPIILPSRLANTLKEFSTVVASEYLDFVWGLSTADSHSLFFICFM